MYRNFVIKIYFKKIEDTMLSNHLLLHIGCQIMNESMNNIYIFSFFLEKNALPRIVSAACPEFEIGQ